MSRLACWSTVAVVIVGSSSGCTKQEGIDEGAVRIEPRQTTPAPHPGTAAPERQPVAGSTFTTPEAVAMLASANCARDQRCGRIGDHAEFGSLESCMRDRTAEGIDKLASCAGDIDAGALDACMSDITQGGCLNPVAAIARLAACRTSVLCTQ
jgi:uncharacterized protein DUF6184